MSQKSQHSNGTAPHTNGVSDINKNDVARNGFDPEQRPSLAHQKSVDIKSNGNYSQSFENSDISENIEELLESPDEDF